MDDSFYTSIRDCNLHVGCFTDNGRIVSNGKLQCVLDNNYYLTTNWVRNGESELNFKLPDDLSEGIHCLLLIYSGSVRAEPTAKTVILFFNTELKQKLAATFIMDDYYSVRGQKITFNTKINTKVKKINPDEFTIIDTKTATRKASLDKYGLHSGLKEYVLWNKQKTIKTCKFKIELIFTHNNAFEVGLGQFNSSGEFIVKAEHSINKNNVSMVSVKGGKSTTGLTPSPNNIITYEFELIDNDCTIWITENNKTIEYSNLGKVSKDCMFFVRKWIDGEIIIKSITYQGRGQEVVFNSDENDGINIDVRGESVLKLNGKSIGHPSIVNGKTELEYTITNMAADVHSLLWILDTNYGIYVTASVLYLKPVIPFISCEYFENKGITEKIRRILNE